jgi:hypothetical protein
VDRYEVNKVTYLTPPSCGQHLIQRKVNRVQNVAESFVPHCREEPEIAVNDPFKACFYWRPAAWLQRCRSGEVAATI